MNLFYHGYYAPDLSSSSAQTDARAAKRDAASAKTDVVFLQQEIDRLALICEALWSVLKTRLNMRDDDLAEVISELDLADGKLDGKLSKVGPRSCDGCGRANSRRHTRCMYCGNVMQAGPFD